MFAFKKKSCWWAFGTVYLPNAVFLPVWIKQMW
jgi:hypothetical protein